MSNSSVKETGVEYFENQDQQRGSARSAIFEGIGWKVRLQQKRSNFFLTLSKELILGNALKRGDEIFYYLINCEGRRALLYFLDGKERPEANEVQITTTAFIVKK